MKHLSYFPLAVVLMLCMACGGGNQAKNNNPDGTTEIVMDTTSIQFAVTTHDFGKVQEGEKVSFSYEFVNTGKASLVIQKAQASCGCTVPKYSDQPIRPGKKGVVEVMFNTKGYTGVQNKSVNVYSNTNPINNVLRFTCEVEPRDKKE